jgi:hypothetical protein
MVKGSSCLQDYGRNACTCRCLPTTAYKKEKRTHSILGSIRETSRYRVQNINNFTSFHISMNYVHSVRVSFNSSGIWRKEFLPRIALGCGPLSTVKSGQRVRTIGRLSCCRFHWLFADLLTLSQLNVDWDILTWKRRTGKNMEESGRGLFQTDIATLYSSDRRKPVKLNKNIRSLHLVSKSGLCSKRMPRTMEDKTLHLWNMNTANCSRYACTINAPTRRVVARYEIGRSMYAT